MPLKESTLKREHFKKANLTRELTWVISGGQGKYEAPISSPGRIIFEMSEKRLFSHLSDAGGAFNKSTEEEKKTHAQEVGEQLQDVGGGVVNVSPVVGGHAGGAVLRGPVVQEVGELLGRPPRAV